MSHVAAEVEQVAHLQLHQVSLALGPDGLHEGLHLGLLHLFYLAQHKLHVLGQVLALLEYAPVAVQKQVRSLLFLLLLFLPEGFDAANGYDRAGPRVRCLSEAGEAGLGQREPPNLHRHRLL